LPGLFVAVFVRPAPR